MAISKTSVLLISGIGLPVVLGTGYFAADNYARDLIADRLNDALKDTATETGVAVTTAGFFEYNVTVPPQTYRDQSKARTIEVKTDSILFSVKPESLTDLAKAAIGKGNAYFQGHARIPESFSAVFKTKHPEDFYGYETVQMDGVCNSTDLTLVLGRDEVLSQDTKGCKTDISASGKSAAETKATVQFDFGTDDTLLKDGSQSSSVRFLLSHMNIDSGYDVTFDGSLSAEIYSWGNKNTTKNMAFNLLGENLSTSISDVFNGSAITLNTGLLDAYVSLSDIDTDKGEILMRGNYQSAGEGSAMVMAGCMADAGNVPFASQQAMKDAFGDGEAVVITPDNEALITKLNKTLAEAVIDAFYECSISTQNDAKKLNISGEHKIKQGMFPVGGGSVKYSGISLMDFFVLHQALEGTSFEGLDKAFSTSRFSEDGKSEVFEYQVDETGTLSIDNQPVKNLLMP